MTTPDAEDASPSPEYSGAPDDMAAEQKTEPHSGNASPDQKAANGQKSASNAKDPLRPRRKKARRACFACQRAHLTCGDERPCNRCIRRGLQDHCMDGVRKKAKYLHDAPDGALMPGVGGHYPHMNGNRPVPLPSQDPGAVQVAQQNNYYTQPPSATYYAPNNVPASLPPGQDDNGFGNQQTPISPPYSQTNQRPVATAPGTVSQGAPAQMQQQFGGALFDPSDPALFNFDISSLNFGNHYGALEFGMLGHMSSGAAESPHNDNNVMNPLNQAASMYNPQMTGTYAEQPSHGGTALSFGPDGLPSTEWQNAQSRHGSMQIQTPNNTPITTTLDHSGHRHDSLNGPQAYAIGQGPSSLSSASPSSTDVNSGYENDNPLAAASFFANTQQQQQTQRSPTVNRLQQENRLPSHAPLKPIQSNAIRKRLRDTKNIYHGITKPYDYVRSFHKLFELINKRYTKPGQMKAREALRTFRPWLTHVAEELTQEDLIHQEKNLQRALLTLQDQFQEVGVPSLMARRSGEVVWVNKEFTILTGWSREVLIGQEPNLNVNRGVSSDMSESELSTNNTTPNISAQEPEPGPNPVNIIEIMDQRSSLGYLQDFAELCFTDSRGHGTQRVNFLRYQTKEDVIRNEETKANTASGKYAKPDPIIKMEGGSVHQGESAMEKLSGKDGMVDCMIMWHIKRDILEMPMLVSMQIMPVLKA